VGPLYNLARHSYLLRLVNVNLVFLRARSVGSIEQTASAADPDIAQAVATTVELLRMMRARAGVPVLVFSARRITRSVSGRCRMSAAGPVWSSFPALGEGGRGCPGRW
jgi:hypothetical protein